MVKKLIFVSLLSLSVIAIGMNSDDSSGDESGSSYYSDEFNRTPPMQKNMVVTAGKTAHQGFDFSGPRDNWQEYAEVRCCVDAYYQLVSCGKLCCSPLAFCLRLCKKQKND